MFPYADKKLFNPSRFGRKEQEEETKKYVKVGAYICLSFAG